MVVPYDEMRQSSIDADKRRLPYTSGRENRAIKGEIAKKEAMQRATTNKDAFAIDRKPLTDYIPNKDIDDIDLYDGGFLSNWL